jgi:Flp pilus assembly protein TadD
VLYAGLVAVVIAGAIRLSYRPQRPTLPAAAVDERTAELMGAAVELDAKIKANPQDLNLRWRLADTHQQLGRLDRAAEQLEAIVKASPKDREARLALANAHLGAGQMAPAEAAFRELTRRDAKDDLAWQGYASTLFHQGRYMEASRAARRAVKLKAPDASGRYILAAALVEYAMQYPNPQNHSNSLLEGRAQFEKLTKEMPKNGDVFYRLGRACIGLRDGKNAVLNLRRAHELMPGRQDVIAELAGAYISMSDRPAARKLAEETVAAGDASAAIHALLGRLIQQSGEAGADERARVAFETAARLDPTNARYQEQLGTAALRSNQLEGARAAFEAAQKLNPHRALPYQQLAAIYTRLGDPVKATEAAKTAQHMTFNDQQLKRFEALSRIETENVALLLVLADRYRDLHLIGPARDQYLAVLHLEPKNARALEGLQRLAERPAGTTAP